MKNRKGQALVEYVLIIALMSILIITLVKVFGGYLKDAITKTSCNLGGYEYVEGKKAGEGSCESKGIDDIFDKDKKEEKDTKKEDPQEENKTTDKNIEEDE